MHLPQLNHQTVVHEVDIPQNHQQFATLLHLFWPPHLCPLCCWYFRSHLWCPLVQLVLNPHLHLHHLCHWQFPWSFPCPLLLHAKPYQHLKLTQIILSLDVCSLYVTLEPMKSAHMGAAISDAHCTDLVGWSEVPTQLQNVSYLIVAACSPDRCFAVNSPSFLKSL